MIITSAQTQISFIEEKIKKIITPYFAAFVSLGSLFAALTSYYFIKHIPNPKFTFIIVGFLLLLSTLFVLILGISKNIEAKNVPMNFKFPEKLILILGVLIMINLASVGIIIDWSSVWLTRDLEAPLYFGGLVIIFFNLGEIIGRLLGNSLIKKYKQKYVACYFSIISAFILGFCIITSDLYFIIVGLIIFGLGTANFLPIVFMQAIKITNDPINATVSNLFTIGFSGFIFGPAIVGYLAEKISLTFNMYLICILWGLNGFILLFIMKKRKLM